MKLLMIGDVVGSCGCRFLAQKLPALKREHGIDITVVNGENSADGNGISRESARSLFQAGADLIVQRLFPAVIENAPVIQRRIRQSHIGGQPVRADAFAQAAGGCLIMPG